MDMKKMDIDKDADTEIGKGNRHGNGSENGQEHGSGQGREPRNECCHGHGHGHTVHVLKGTHRHHYDKVQLFLK